MGVNIIIVISAVVSLAYSWDCNSEMKLGICMSGLTGYSGDTEVFCSAAAVTETCVALALDECPNLRSSYTARNMEMMQNQISSICPSTNGDGGEGHGHCLEGVFNSCSSKPEIQQMMAGMNTATMRKMLGSCRLNQ